MTDFPLVYIGTPNFVPLLLNYIRNASPGLPVEPVILQSLLLCLISGNKHLILRTSEDDVGLVVKLAVKVNCHVHLTYRSTRPINQYFFLINSSVVFVSPYVAFSLAQHPLSQTLSTVFGILTHRLRIHRLTGSLVHDLATIPTVPAFLRSLFIPSPGAQDEASTMTGHGTRRYRKRPSSRSHSRSATIRSMASQYTKSLSYPNDLDSRKSLNYNGAPSLSLSASDPFGDYNSPNIVGTSALSSASRNSSLSAMPHPSFPHSYSDPTPLRPVKDPPQMQLPGALVISGLENASIASQRTLVDVLTERRVVLEDDIEIRGKNYRHSTKSATDTDTTNMSSVWPLPQGFLLVYVCSLDERERPPIHKPLLDKFAMSATVSLHPTVRSLAKSFFRPLSLRSSPILSPIPQAANYPPNSTPPFLSQPLPQRHISPGIMTPSNGFHAVITPEAMGQLKETYSQVHIPSTLNLYLSDLFSAARHHHQLEGQLLSVIATNDALELSRAARVLGGDPTGMELVNDILDMSEDSGSTSTDVGGTTTGDDRLSKGLNNIDGTYVVIDPSGTRISTDEQMAPHELPVLDVTQADIARVVPRVLSHRLRVRDGPEDEVLAGAVFGAAFPLGSRQEERGRQLDRERNRVTVKELLVRILQDV
ncbi:hypothetical protein BDP27DRAFT_1417088 [Rhodocollybia butyracea]|uniref:Uncharacterized protein n=1 Tax=Rhodocollybia butyracea TaxID=206335 RepID=A0A9P5Q3Y4_9AGAR|nr:hypothetical protein BDP27DRAFT_1417088 [Rhodocollybia butyracea]